MIKLKQILESFITVEWTDQDDKHAEAESETGHWGRAGAGCIFLAKDTKRFLISFRSGHVNTPHTWGVWGGAIDDGEDPTEAVKREIQEETGYVGPTKLYPLYVYKDGTFRYFNFLAVVENEFKPRLDWETENYKWVDFGDWPTPLHYGLKSLLDHDGEKIKSIVSKELNEISPTIPPNSPAIHNKINNPSPKIQHSIEDGYIVAATIWGEARGEGEKGMLAVLNVIMNRAKGDISKAKEIVLKPKQFSFWNSKSNPQKFSIDLARSSGKDNQFQKAVELVDKAMKGTLPDITHGALFYFNPKLANPSWANKMIKTISIGNHDFYKLKGK